MVTIQLRRIIDVNKIYKNSTNWYPAFNEFPLTLQSKSFFAYTNQIPFLSLPMSRLASQLLNKYLHCNAMIFVYRVSYGNLVLSTELKT